MTTPYYADGLVTIHAGDCLDVLATLPDASVDAVVTDPPYGLEFMGKEWDAPWRAGEGTGEHNAGFGPGAPAVPGVRGAIKSLPSYLGGTNPTCRNCGGTRNGNDRASRRACRCDEPSFPNTTLPRMVAFQAWCEAWATECLRVLKPGGHLLAFGGTRTWHRLACAVEDAGFEVRDSIAWLYGSGFPKSLDVSKAIDKARRRDYVAAALRLDMPIPGRNVDDWTKEDHSPGDKWWAEFRAHLPDKDWQAIEREVVGQGTSGPAVVAFARDRAGTYNLTAPATDDARTWQGWGTALKPAFEPVVVARKPLVGTVAANVLAHGTGALNVDGCRINPGEAVPGGGGLAAKGSMTSREYQAAQGYRPDGDPYPADMNTGSVPSHAVGRWPANVVLDESQATELDAQSGTLQSGDNAIRTKVGSFLEHGGLGRPGDVQTTYGDSGGASRFFYVAKADTNERVRINGTAHPTVKPLALMRWLVRLVTPPGGIVLEPFAGSGTTVEACILENFHCIAIEREPDYLPLIVQRINRRRDPLAAIKATGDDGGLFDLLEEGA